MGEANFTVLDSRGALVRAIHILRHSTDEQIDKIFRAIYGEEMKSSCAKIHAAVYAERFEVLLNDFDERYMPQLIQRQAEMDSLLEGSASTGGNQRMQESHP